MTKEQLITALREASDGANLSSDYWDEFVTISELIHNVTDEQVTEAWKVVHETE